MKSLALFCGSNVGNNPLFGEVVAELATHLAKNSVRVIYGGGRVGLMGVIADAALKAKGEVIGVIPRSLIAKEVAHQGLTQLIPVETMHERKAKMYELADGFVALPGGFGTLDEFCEIFTWAQLGFHGKPCAILNVNGYFDGLLAQISRGLEEGFIKREHAEMVLVSSDWKELLERMDRYQPSTESKWVR